VLCKKVAILRHGDALWAANMIIFVKQINTASNSMSATDALTSTAPKVAQQPSGVAD